MARASLLPVFGVPAAICTAWTVYAGKDVSWDLLNYHYYLPFEFLAGRLAQDFFAASAQSYLNPLGYLPFYLMVSSGWHSVAASSLLAAAHGVSLAFLYLVARRLFAHLPPRERLGFSLIAAALGAATAVFWMTVGSSSLDPLLAALMLGGLLLLLGPGEAPRRAALAGALFGAAAALKHSSAVFALAALPLALALPAPGAGGRMRAGLAYAAGGALAFGLLAGPWMALLWREFGNPVFPLFNGWFQSPHALPFNLTGARFVPEDLGAALALPFRMAFLGRALYSENFAPDIRFATLIAVLLALVVLSRRRPATSARALQGTDWRVLGFLGLGSALWIATSANARYGMVLLLLVGVCLARAAERLLPAGAARIALAVILAVQLAASVLASPPRWFIAEPWSQRWLPYEVPERARREPALYVTVEALPMAVLAPFVHPESSFVNLRGQHSLPTDSPRLTKLLERHRGRVRTLGRGLELRDGSPDPDRLRAYDATLLRIGYRVDPEQCFVLAWSPDRDDWLSRAANRVAGALADHEPLSAVSCSLVAAKRDAADLAEEQRVSALFDRMERRCPQLFRGQSAVTERLGEGWSRNYTGLDSRLEAFGDRVVLNRYRAQTYFDLGLLSSWTREDGAVPPVCQAGR